MLSKGNKWRDFFTLSCSTNYMDQTWLTCPSFWQLYKDNRQLSHYRLQLLRTALFPPLTQKKSSLFFCPLFQLILSATFRYQTHGMILSFLFALSCKFNCIMVFKCHTTHRHTHTHTQYDMSWFKALLVLASIIITAISTYMFHKSILYNSFWGVFLNQKCDHKNLLLIINYSHEFSSIILLAPVF